MKRFVYLLSIAGFMALTACDPDLGNDNGGSDLPEGVSVQAEATAGTKVTVKGTGFSENAKFYLKDASGNDIELKAEVLSAGAEVVLPYNLGEFTMLVDQSGETVEVGKITVKVTGVQFPETVAPGAEFEVTGDGFAEDAVLVLSGADKQSYELETTYSTGKLTARTDADFAAGTYSLSVKQAGTSQVFSEEFVVEKIVMKRLIGVEVKDMATFSVTYDENGFPATFDGQSVEHTGNTFAVADYGFSLNVENSKVTGADIDGEVYPWEYDAEGYLQIANGYNDEYLIVFDANGNYDNENFAYNDPSLVNPLSNVDLGLLNDSVAMYGDPAFVMSIMCGWGGRTSVNLPSGIIVSYDGEQPVMGDIHYEYDEDGYVIGCSMEELGMFFTYEYEICE